MAKPNIPEESVIAIADNGNQGGMRMWPSEEWASRLADWANIGLIGSLITGVVSTVVLVWMANVKETHLKMHLGATSERAAHAEERAANVEAGNIQLRIDLENATSESTKRQMELQREQQKTAEAQQRAAEVQLALREAVGRAAASRRIIMGNRNGDQEIREAKFKELGKYADTPAIIVFVHDEEAEILAGDIRNALIKAGWKSVPIIDRATAHLPLGLIQQGVQVRTLQRVDGDVTFSAPVPGTKPSQVAEALISLLNLDLGPPVGSPFGVIWQPDAIINGRPLGALLKYGFQIPENGIVITVGRKPTEEFFFGIPDSPVKKK